MALDPNIILAAGRTPSIDPATILDAGNRIALGKLALQRGQQTQQALDRVRANPDDPDAVTNLAALDPAAGNAYLSAQAAKLAGRARAARSDLARSLAPADAAPVAAAAPATAPPGTGATIALPGASGAPTPTSPAPSAAGGGDPFDHQGPATQIVGAQIASGRISPQEAAAHLLAVSDPEDLAKTVGALKSLDDQQFDRVKKVNATTADAVQPLLQIPDDPSHAARHAALMQAAPQLAALGITPQQLAGMDLSDQGIHGVVGRAAGFQGVIDQANKDRDFGLKASEVAETHRHNVVGEQDDKGKVVPFGSVYVGSDGKVIYDGSGASGGSQDTTRLLNSDAGGGQVPSSVQTLGQFVTYGKDLNAKGAKSSSAGTYQINGTTMAEFGPQALGPNWRNAPFNADTQEKVGEAIFNWAKSQSNPAAALKGRWASLNSATAKQIAGGTWDQAKGVIAAGETGGGSGASAGPQGAGGMTAAAIDLAARQGIANGGQVPTGYSRNRAAQAAITNRMAELAQGRSATDIIADGAALHADKGGLAALQKRATIVLAAENAAQDNGRLALSLAPAVGNGNIAIFNQWRNAGGRATGNANVDRFNASVETFANEYATVMGKGVPTDSLRTHAHDMLNTSQSPDAFRGTMQTLFSDMSNVRKGLQTERNDTLRRISGARPSGTLSPRASGGAPPSAAAYLKANPGLRAQFDAKYGSGAAASVLGG